jgi:ribose transport system substrate-binding protein
MIRNVAFTALFTRQSRKPIAIAAVVTMAIAIALSGCATTSAPPTSHASGDSHPDTCAPSTTTSSNAAVVAAQKVVNQASLPVTKWDGPKTGPKAAQNKTVVFIVSNAANAGDTGVQTGFKEAATAIGWKTVEIDGNNSTSGNIAALNQAIALKPAAIAVSSFNPNSEEPEFAAAKSAGIVVIGNHTGTGPGYTSEYPALFTNITSDPVTIGAVAADCAIVAGGGAVSVTVQGCGKELIICQVKQDSMDTTITKSKGSSVLKDTSFPFENINQQEPGVTTADYQKFGSKLQYMLSINDLYWDAAIPALQAVGVKAGSPPYMIAAGDGSPAAFSRIRAGQFQIASVAEPLNEHGWQMIDEINRALNGVKPSTFVTYPRLVTKSNVDSEGGKKNTFDPDNSYRDGYKAIWGVK